MPTPHDPTDPISTQPAGPRALRLVEDAEGIADARRAARRARLIAVGHPSVTDPADVGDGVPFGPGPATAPPAAPSRP